MQRAELGGTPPRGAAVRRIVVAWPEPGKDKRHFREIRLLQRPKTHFLTGLRSLTELKTAGWDWGDN